MQRGKSREIAIRRTQSKPVLDREGGQVGVHHEVRVHAW